VFTLADFKIGRHLLYYLVQLYLSLSKKAEEAFGKSRWET
jgi:hypothetical protein